ncbi:hypothetical protein TrispH2_003517 [Trichoplax sp. H2]|nr:hypothetical protein TrispH2_003517 [Trichoplax sp. H2]|eukprot:RDD45574.1 hypothetical protein TrispH2_003517 [Trichoplax sp. H2]
MLYNLCRAGSLSCKHLSYCTKPVVATMSRIFAISDLHVDYGQNWAVVNDWSDTDYNNDVLILAGDVTDSLELLKSTLILLRQKFAQVCFVPGNHDVWVRKHRDGDTNSIAKFGQILNLCQRIGIKTKPTCVSCIDNSKVWLVPIYSWYTQPEEDEIDSLYFPSSIESRRMSREIWSDNYNCKWPDGMLTTISEHFADLNDDFITDDYDAPVITFSHFLPRQELIASSHDDDVAVSTEREFLGLPKLDYAKRQGALAGFNFSIYAGSKYIDKQLRQCKSVLHVFGHQHRNRDRVIDNVRYVSHCLGYHKERQDGLLWGLRQWQNGPKMIWPVPTKDEAK